MKTIIVISLGILAILVFVQAYIVKATNDTEQQKYEVIESQQGFEIRYYPAATLASVNMSGDYSRSSGSGFRILAGYIFGSNDQEKKIAMTAPVHMKESENGYSMSFVMPSGYDTSNLPVPDNTRIQIHNSEPAYTASIRFGGFSNDEKINEHKEKLKQWLEEEGIRYSGPFTYLGYNPPYQMTNRRNEVMVRIDYNMKASD